MKIGHENGFSVGDDRYGSRHNDDGCAQCGHSFYQHSTGYDNQWHCKPGCKCDGFYLKNAGPMRCSCGGRIEKVGDDRFECDDCGQMYERDDWRADRLKAIQNAGGRLIVAGGDSDKVAFVHCQTCDEGIDESKIQKHLADGHTVEKVMKVERKNDSPADRRDNAQAAGQERYGGRDNEKPYWEQEKGQSFKCDQCKDEFWTRQSLAEHKKNVHGKA